MKRPYFLWDYDLSEDQVRSILHGKNETEKIWLMGRILTHARYDDVWKYVTVEDIVTNFSKLRMDTQLKNTWEQALSVWGYHV